ncbi:PAS domain S-box protein [Winogradskyella forsetii]|uniref:PAS domain S-box protein n=1 Tax=Winogradskyella forsetii TaxID=2686077 RepID=UPI0015BA5943|nr:PAS domain S-box protein [Winogradskyella forsetii]
MTKEQLSNLFVEQSKDLIWMINPNFDLIFANKAYLSLMKQITGQDKKLNDTVFGECFGEDYIKKWKAYYKRALNGETFEVEDHLLNTEKEKIQYSYITFKPITDENNDIVSVACQSKDITRLVKQQSEVKQLIDSSLDVFCTFNEQGEFLYVNKTAKEHWGYEPEELLGTNYRALVIEEDGAVTDSVNKTIRNGQEIKSFSNRYRKKNGGIAYNIWSSRWDQRTKLFYAVARDGKEKLEQEKKLIQSEQRFKALVTGAFDLVAVIDIKGHYLFMSPSIMAIAGIPPEEFIGKNAFEFVHPDDIEQIQADFKASIKKDRVIMKPYRAKNVKNEWRWVETILTNMLENPAIKGIVINSRDITEKIKQEEKIIRTEKRFETLIENSTDCITIISPEGKTNFISKAIKNILGYTPSEAMELDIWEQIHPEDIECSKVALSEAIKKPGVSIEGHTSRMKHKDGSWRWVNPIITNLIHDPSIEGIVDVIRDVTKQKTEELEKEFINKIYHLFDQKEDNDLTNILSSVCGKIVEFGQFSFSEIWLPTLDKQKLNLKASSSGSKAGKTFYRASKKIDSLVTKDGLQSLVIKHKKIVIWESADEEWNSLKRKAELEMAGIKSLIGIPLIHNDKLLGGLLIGSEKVKSSLSVNLEFYHKLESTLGSELSRKKTEVELNQIFSFAPDMICVAGFDGYIKRINPAGLALLGYSLEEIRSRPIKSFVHEEDQSQTEKKQHDLHTGKNLENFENRYITKEGKVIWLSWTATSSPEQGIIYAVAKDITQEKKLRELNRQVGVLAKIGSWEVDLVTKNLFWSEEVHKLYETDAKTFVPTVDAAINFYREDYRQLALSKFEKCIETGESYNIEAVIVTSSNKERWVRTTAKAEFVDGLCTRVFGSFQDIDAQKQAENRLQSLADNLPGIIYNYAIYPDGTDALLHVAGDVEKIWGFTANQVMENSDLLWEQIKLGGDFEEVQASIQKSIQTKSKWINRSKYVSPTGEVRNLLGFGSPSFLADGTIFFDSIILDNTQQAKNEELLSLSGKLAKIGGWEVNFVNKSVYWTKEVHLIHETDPNSFIPTFEGAINFYRKDFHELVKYKVEECIRTGEPYEMEAVLITTNKKELWVKSNGCAEFIDGVCTRIYGSIQDINEKKIATLALENSLRELKDYKYSLDQAAIIAFTDQKGVITSVNYNFCRISGYSRKELLGKTHRIINSNYHSDMFFKELWLTIVSGKVWRGEFKNKAKNGDYFWVDTTIVPFLNEKKKPKQYLAIRFDITERKKAEDEKARFQETLENSLNEIYIFDSKTFKFGYVNKGAMLNLGYTKQELQNLTPLDLKPEYTEESFRQLVSPLISHEKEKIIFFTKHRRKDGSIYPVEVHLKLVEETDYTNFIAIILDITEREKAEQDLIATSERLQLATKTGNIGIWDWDVLNNQLIWDETMFQIFGIEENEFQGTFESLEANIHPDDINMVKEIVQNALEDFSKFSTEFRVVKDDKSIRYVTGEAIVIRDEISGRPIRMIGTNRDITERKKAEQDILLANERFEKVTEATNDAIWDWDIINDKFYRSDAIERFFGKKTRKSITSKDFWKDRFHEDDLSKIQKSVEEAIANPLTAKWKMDYKILNEDGDILYLIDQGVIIRNEKGEAVRMVGAMTDVTELKKAEEESRFKANLLSMVRQAAIATDLDGEVNYWNKGAEVMYGWKAEEALGMNIMQLTTLETNKEEAWQIMQLLKKGKSWSGDFKVQKKDGTNLTVKITNSPIFNENDELSGIIGISTDISKEIENKKLLKRYTKELERSNEELEQFAFVTSHDLQEPLRMISSFMDQLKRKYEDQLDEKALQHIYFATDGAKRMKHIILDLLDYSRASKPSEEIEKVNLNELIATYRQLRRKVISETSATIIASELPTIKSYSAVVTQIFHGLLDNAIKYARDGVAPIIEIEAREKEKEWEFSITDNGIGIDPQFFDKIFLIFQRLHNRNKYDGTGIGLAIVKRSVEFLNGHIWLTSTVGKGTTFFFTISKNKVNL